MKEKLLNVFKNLIIISTLVIVLISIFSTSVFAASSNKSIDVLMRQKIAGWYYIVRSVSMAIMLILLIIAGIKLIGISVSSADRALFKQVLLDWVVGFILLFFIHYFMYYVININDRIVNKMLNWGYQLSGLTDKGDNEYDLYEYAMTKAYELKFTSGTIGMIMYIMLVVYSYKFVIIYAKRYLNVIVLVLIGPIICVIRAFKKVLNGKVDDSFKRWVKEFIYNVMIQSVHALFYASLIGITLALSDEKETTIGALLTLLIFSFIFKLDKLIRKIFNFFGGNKTITQISVIGTIQNAKSIANSFDNGRRKESGSF